MCHRQALCSCRGAAAVFQCFFALETLKWDVSDSSRFPVQRGLCVLLAACKCNSRVRYYNRSPRANILLYFPLPRCSYPMSPHVTPSAAGIGENESCGFALEQLCTFSEAKTVPVVGTCPRPPPFHVFQKLKRHRPLKIQSPPRQDALTNGLAVACKTQGELGCGAYILSKRAKQEGF